jgi:flagellar biosynthetic protein FliO
MNKRLASALALVAVLLAASVAGQDTAGQTGAAGGPDLDSQLIGSAQRQAAPEAPKPLDWTALVDVVVSLAIVIGLVGALVWALRRFAPRAVRMYSSDSLKVLSRTFVGPKQMVCLVKAAGRILVVGATQQSVTLLSEITDSAEVEKIAGAAEAASSKSATAAFKDMVSNIARPRRASGEEELASAAEGISQKLSKLARKLERHR